jgi:hypothetical protein
MILVPEKLRRPWFTVPLCILCFSLGMLLLSFLVFPSWHPEVYERMACRHLQQLVADLGLVCVLLPVTLLYWATPDGEPDEEP